MRWTRTVIFLQSPQAVFGRFVTIHVGIESFCFRQTVVRLVGIAGWNLLGIVLRLGHLVRSFVILSVISSNFTLDDWFVV